MGLKRVLLAFSLGVLVLLSVGGPSRVQAQTATPPGEVRQIFQKMTPEERVGQLFLVAFTGTDIADKSQIYDMIVNHHIGGVVLMAGNDNFAAAPDTISAAHQLIQNLQQIEWESASKPSVESATGQLVNPTYVPLFVGLSQEGDGSPSDQILRGLTHLPSEMAIGAAWSPELAEKVGAVMGGELSALGVNMYFGPSLDVLESPNPSASSDLGTSVFGGDPYWVGEMGRAYVSGLHAGGENRLMVIVKHFPGRGSSDRPSEEEVATVRKSLEQLKQIELAPFFAVTGNAPSVTATADGLLVSHIRYQGFQGNIRATTRPVSFDPQALSTILGLPQFSSWRENGGLIVSDDLGTRAVRQFYSTGTDFPARIVARDALVAGNDLLYLGNIVSSDAPDTYSTDVEILDFFAQKYREDSTFAQRVDAAALRVLSMKYRLYGRFDYYNNVVVPSAGLDTIGQSDDVALDVARRAATLISPDAQDLSTLIPTPPQVRDRLIFFTDTAQIKQCSSCPPQPTLGVDAFQNAVVQLYGPQSGNQTSTFRLSSYSYDDLAGFLAGNSPPYLEDDLFRASWVILALTDQSRGQPQLISRFFSEHQDSLRDKRVLLFSFGAPYYLDATDISRLTAYFALYSKQPPFVEVAARLLFQELTPAGASPVSIPSLGYDLITTTSPDPNQIIPLALDLPAASVPTDLPTPAATPVPLFKIGDTIAIRAGVIKDHNGHPVPDGTVVHFSMTLTGEGGGILQQADAITSQGAARVSFGLDKPGLLQIRATSDPAKISEVLQLDVSSAGQPAAVTVIVPAFTPETAPQAPRTPQPQQNNFVTPQGSPRFAAWVLVVMLLLGGAALAYWMGTRIENMRWGIRWGLCAIAGGLLAYNYIALGLPGGADFAATNGIGGMISLALMGLLIGWGAGWLWSRRAAK
jgi:beta-N-acetylhexosaminidase